MTHERLVWIDMEMTGLEPAKERIIEIAVIITDTDLKILEEGPNLVIRQPSKVLDGMDEWNKKHHGKSGLIDAVRASKITVKEAEKIVLEFVKKHVGVKKPLLCGNSVHHDRRFIERYMPRLHEMLHYRHIDVSTIKAIAKYWYPQKKVPYNKKNTHRALDDIRESIEELKHYRKLIFKAKIKA